MSQPTFSDITLFHASTVSPDGAVAPASEEAIVQKQLSAAHQKLVMLLPIRHLDLTENEQQKIQVYQQARLILGAAGAAPMICEGEECPFRQTCPLFSISKHPIHDPCPFESNYVTERFLAWMIELGRTLETLTESERSVISQLTYLDVHEQRMVANLATANNALMQSRSVRDVDVETGQPICWEDIVHISQQNLDQITARRRMLMKDFELTPEQKTKRKKALGERDGNDAASRWSSTYDRLKKNRQKPLTIEVKAEPAQ